MADTRSDVNDEPPSYISCISHLGTERPSRTTETPTSFNNCHAQIPRTWSHSAYPQVIGVPEEDIICSREPTPRQIDEYIIPLPEEQRRVPKRVRLSEDPLRNLVDEAGRVDDFGFITIGQMDLDRINSHARSKIENVCSCRCTCLQSCCSKRCGVLVFGCLVFSIGLTVFLLEIIGLISGPHWKSSIALPVFRSLLYGCLGVTMGLSGVWCFKRRIYSGGIVLALSSISLFLWAWVYPFLWFFNEEFGNHIRYFSPEWPFFVTDVILANFAWIFVIVIWKQCLCNSK